MRGYTLGLAVLAALCAALIASLPAPGQAAPGFTGTGQAATLLQPVGVFHHRKREQAFYCYPRKYWWFYRPYTTEPQDYERCMPYFHYLGPGYGRPAKAYRDSDIK